MPKKETGSVFVGKCPVCGDELVVGWLRDEIPCFSPEDIEKGTITQKVAKKNAENVSIEKITCTCGKISAEFDPTKGRAVFEWPDGTQQPAIGNMNLH